MGILQVIVDSFIVAMGITPPKPKMRRTATIFIATGLLGLGVALTALSLFLIALLLRA
jgi:hypothetical protein